MNDYTKAYILCFITIVFFSTIEVVSKNMTMSAEAITGYRFLFGALVMLPFAIKKLRVGNRKLKLRDFRYFALAGVLNVCLSMLFLQLSVFYGKASLAAILISTNPIFAALFGLLILREQVTTLKMSGIVFGLIGIILVVGGHDFALSGAANIELGIIMGIFSAVFFGLYIAVTKKYVKRYGNVVFNCFSFLCGSVILLAFSALAGKNMMIPRQEFIQLLYLGIFVTSIAYLLFFEALKSIPVVTGSMFFLLKPVIASILAYMLHTETLTGVQVIGIAIVIVSLILANMSQKKNSLRPKMITEDRN